MPPGSSSLTHVYFLQDYKEEQDPSKFKSEKTGRGPLGPDWKVFNSVFINNVKIVQFQRLLIVISYRFTCRRNWQMTPAVHICAPTN